MAPLENPKFDEKAQKIFEAEDYQATPQRQWSPGLQNYDEIIAISEGSLNSVLQLRFNKTLKKNKDRRLREFNHAISQFGDIKATLSAPHIRMIVDAAPQTVRFYVNFEKGNFQYWVGQGPWAEKRSQDIQGWSIAFKIDFSIEKLDSVPAAIRDKIKLLKLGSYSVSQIVLGLSAARLAWIDWDSSVYPGVSNELDVQIIILDAFKKYFDIYVGWLSKGPYSVLGYALHVNDKPDGMLLPPNFPPTAVKCITQMYMPLTTAFRVEFPSTSSSTKPSRAGLDSLVFLEMTDNREWPGTPYNSTQSGNWITGSVSSSLALSKRVFWDCYLLDRFSALNMQILTVANDMFHWVMYSKREAVNPWKIAQGNKPGEASWQSTTDGAVYSWTGEYKDKDGLDYDITTTKIDNAMKWIRGSDVVKVDVKVKQSRKYNQSAKGEFDMGHSFTQETLLTWSLTLRLNTIKAGALEAVITYDTPNLESKRSDSQSFWDWGGLIEKYQQDTINTIKSRLDVAGIQSQLSSVLSGKGTFVFPGAGDFAMRDPVFTLNGDLLVTLQLVAGQLIIDDDFHLRVAAPGQASDGQWVKVAKDGNAADFLLVASQSQASLFQTDDGKLTVDVQGLPTGQRASVGPANAPAPGQMYTLQDVFFDTPDMAKTRPQTIDFYTTGSGIFYSVDGKYWWNRFVLEDQKLRLFLGNPPADGVQLPVKPFLLQAVY